jgi:hypothetical protein
MADGRTELEIRIRTIAEEQGIKLTEQGLQKVKEQTQQLGSAFDKNTASTSKVTEEMKRAAQETLRMQVESTKAGGSTRNLTKELGGLKDAGSGANQVITGLNQGGLGGLINASRGAITVVKSLATGALGSLLLPATAAAGVALVGLNKIAAKLNADMAKMWDAAAKSREDSAARQAAASAIIEASFKKELAAIEAVIEAIGRRDAMIDKSRERADRLDEPQRALRDQAIDMEETAALAKAKTPEAQAKVRAEFSRRREAVKVTDTLGGFKNAESRADIDIANAEGDIRNANQGNRNAEAAVRAAQDELDQATTAAKAFDRRKADGSFEEVAMGPQALEARARVRDAQAKLDKLKGVATETTTQNAKIIESAQAQIDAANLVKEETALRRQFYQNALKQQSDAAAPAEKKAIKEAVEMVEGAPKKEGPGMILGEMTTSDGKTVIARRDGPSSGGTITRDGRTVKVEGENTIAELAKTGEALGKVFKSVEYFSTKVTSDANKLDQKLKNTSESRAGT